MADTKVLTGQTVEEKVRDSLTLADTRIGRMLVNMYDAIDDNTDINLVLEHAILAAEFVEWWEIDYGDLKDELGCSLFKRVSNLGSIMNGTDMEDRPMKELRPEGMSASERDERMDTDHEGYSNTGSTQEEVIQMTEEPRKTVAEVAGTVAGKTVVASAIVTGVTARAIKVAAVSSRKYMKETGTPALKKAGIATGRKISKDSKSIVGNIRAEWRKYKSK